MHSSKYSRKQSNKRKTSNKRKSFNKRKSSNRSNRNISKSLNKNKPSNKRKQLNKSKTSNEQKLNMMISNLSQKLHKNIEVCSVISSFLILYTMIIIYLGSGGNTKKEISNVLNISENDDYLINQLSEKQKILNIHSDNLELQLSVALLVKSDFKVNTSYKDLLNKLNTQYFQLNKRSSQKNK